MISRNILSFFLAAAALGNGYAEEDRMLRGRPDQTSRKTADATPFITATTQTDLPNGEPLACEWEWSKRLLVPFQNHNPGQVPRRMYMASCATDTPAPQMFTSYTLGEKVDMGLTGTSGAITKSAFNPDTGKMEVVETQHFPECRSMHGIAASESGCGRVAALCRISYDAIGYDHDAIKKHSEGDSTLTNEISCGGYMLDHMWLYEWDDGDISKTPTKIIVHKSIGGGWEYGQNYLRMGNDGTYGIALKTTDGDKGNDCHQADSYMILRSNTWEFDETRGYSWACGTGHTMHNRPAYDPKGNKYAMLCSTDFNDLGETKKAEVVFRREDQGDNERSVIHHVPLYNANYIKGGAGPIVARPSGGFIGIIVGEPEGRGAGYDDTTATRLGLVTFDNDGNPVGDVNWIAYDDQYYYSWPQLASLGGDRYLLGYGIGYEAGTRMPGEGVQDRDLSLKLPWTYFTMEIDGDGNKLTAPMEVKSAGWGEVNEMVPLGPGRVAWSYAPNSRRIPGEENLWMAAPDCNQDELVHYVYTSATVGATAPTPSPPVVSAPTSDPVSLPTSDAATSWRLLTTEQYAGGYMWNLDDIYLYSSSDCSSDSVIDFAKGTVFDSDHHPAYEPIKAFGSEWGKWAGLWDSAQSGKIWIGVTFPSAAVVRCVQFNQPGGSTTTRVELQSSNDGSSWTTRATGEGLSLGKGTIRW